MNILVTGGHGFIGSNFIDLVIDKQEVECIVNIDCPTKIESAADINNTISFCYHPKYHFYDRWLDSLLYLSYQKRFITNIMEKHKITHVVHFAAETHVDTSITNPQRFLHSNVVATHNLLEIIRLYPVERYHQISTDEVYGSLDFFEEPFTELSPIKPSSPYSASKAAADFYCNAYHHTYKLPITISRCSNNYGPKQAKEKFIPKCIDCLLNKRKIPLYGTGLNVRDWIYVADHCEAVWKILMHGKIGECYNIGGQNELANIDVIYVLCNLLGADFDRAIKYVEDRKGHDRRYAIDNTKIAREIGWKPSVSFDKGLLNTIKFYKK